MKAQGKLALRQRILSWILRFAGGLLILLMALLQSATAAPVSLFTPPSSITVRMFELNYPGGENTYVSCSPGDTAFGCTAFVSDSNHAYPYGTSNPVTIPIETDYLLDVVPNEISVKAFHPTAIQAQAIAARSYAYWHINQGSTINNSNQFQVFVPYAFEALPSAASPNFPDNPNDPCASTNLNNDQRIVCSAVAPRYYISYGTYPNDDLPAFTEYFGDIRNRTVSGGQPYLIAVDDPISSHPDIVNDGHGHGMSQKGASRWARGNLSYNINRDLGAWSVRWERAEQILVHYYTGVHIRDASNNNALLTPSYRWNPLQINWGTADNYPPLMYHGHSYTVTVQVQNTSISDWLRNGQSWALSYHWAKAGFGEIDGSHQAWTDVDVPKGDPPYTFSLTIDDVPNWGPGKYTLKFDMIHSTHSGEYWFGRDYGWPTYDVCVTCKVFIPVVLKND